MYTNHLIHEKSPYLLQHAHNPVDWHPWGAEAFARARTENKPIFLSIGYSTCHWCHVMAHQSFEDPAIAEILNAHFICVKVDREERPDVDQVYMAFVQAATGSGGWPMSVWLTPDLKPIFGGTYFTPQHLTALTAQIADAWETDRAKINAGSEHVLEALRKMVQPGDSASDELGTDNRANAFQQIAGIYDGTFGGFGTAPKFPRPVTFNFLYSFCADHPESPDGRRALEMTLFTLRQMAAGGIHDHLGGGFHRYSVDRFWHVPHFEKMLYDQAQLAEAYLKAFLMTRDPLFEHTVRDILDYVQRDLTAPSGGFFSAEDADSRMAHDSSEQAEGAFYVWTLDEIVSTLDPEAAHLFAYRFGVEPEGNAPEEGDPRGEFKGRNILFQRHSLAETAKHFGLNEAQATESLARSRQRLFEAREKRPRPYRDDKIITAWNGLMISALARAAQVLDEPRYREAAVRSAKFVRENLYREADQTLLRSYRNGASPVEGFAADYAFLVQGLLDLYEADFDYRWIEWAITLQERQDALFGDDAGGGYFSTTGQDSTILLRSKEDHDGAEPSSNSIATLNLLRLAQILDRTDWHERARKAVRAFSLQLEQAPTAMPQMLVALDWLHGKPLQIVIAGKPDTPDTRALLREVNRRFIPAHIIILADGSTGQRFFAERVEFMKYVEPLQGLATAYVCRAYVCRQPTSDPSVLAKLLSAP